jgi:hypothetical protein
MVPYDATTSPTNCSSPTISLDNQTDVRSTLTTLFYTPCDLSMANQTTFAGQIYSGHSLNVNNQFTMQFIPVPMPDGAVTSVGGVKGYTLDVVYKRESRNP